MAQSPILLFAGPDETYQRVIERLPRATLVRCQTAAEVIARANTAALAIVDERLSGGGEALCRTLRDDDTSSGLPLVLCAAAGTQSVWADQVVDRVALDALEEAVRELCPDALPSRSPGGYAWSPQQATRAAEVRAAEESAAPAAGELDILDATRARTDFLSTLMQAPANDAANDAAGNSEAIDGTTKLLGDSQRAINDALKSASLLRMRELTTARNALFEKLQHFRSHAARTAAGGNTGAPAATNAAPPAVPSNGSKLSSSGASALATSAAPAKSALTLAAEAKEREAAQEARVQGGGTGPHRAGGMPPRPTPPRATPPRSAPQRRGPQGAAPRGGRRGLALWLVGGGVLGVAAAAALLLQPPSAAKQSPVVAQQAPANNQRPHVTEVAIEQTEEGLRVRPLAKDPENDPINFRIRWLVNGTPVAGAHGAMLARKEYPRKATVQVEITASDPFGAGRSKVSRPLRADGTRGKRR